jgi:mRNA interferase MazF
VTAGLPARGEVWWCELPEIARRPVVVLSRDTTIPRRRRVIVAPCTTKIRGIETEVVLDPEVDPVPKPSAASLDAVQDVSMVELVERLGRLSADRMRAICDALAVAVDCGG